MQAKNNRKWLVGFVASATLTGLPAPALFNNVLPLRTASAGPREDLQKQLENCDKEMRDEEARWAQQQKNLRGKVGQLKTAREKFEARMGELRGRRDGFKKQLDERRFDNAATGTRPGNAPVTVGQNKLDNLNDLIAAENQRHTNAMKKIPAGSMAAVQEKQKHEDRLRELQGKREDMREDRQNLREVRETKQEYLKDVAGLKRELDAEEARHQKAMKFLPAYSSASQEETRFHEQKVREINAKFENAAGNRDVKVAEVKAERQFDGELDQVKKQITDENTVYDRRMREMNAGSQAAVDERDRHNRTMASLQARQQDLLRRQGEAAARTQRAVEIRKQLSDIDAKLAVETDKHNRLMNLFDAGSQQVTLEKDRYAKATADLRARKQQLTVELASIEGGGNPTAAGR
jgi:chromosome segregation ATPase